MDPIANFTANPLFQKSYWKRPQNANQEQMDGVHHGYFLFPPDYNTARTNLFVDLDGDDPLYHTMTKYRFTGDQIKNIGEKFQGLHDAIAHHSGLILSGRATFSRAVRGVDILGGKLHGR